MNGQVLLVCAGSNDGEDSVVVTIQQPLADLFLHMTPRQALELAANLIEVANQKMRGELDS